MTSLDLLPTRLALAAKFGYIPFDAFHSSWHEYLHQWNEQHLRLQMSGWVKWEDVAWPIMYPKLLRTPADIKEADVLVYCAMAARFGFCKAEEMWKSWSDLVEQMHDPKDRCPEVTRGVRIVHGYIQSWVRGGM